MFAFWFNATFAVIYTALAARYPNDVTYFTIWAAGLHTGFALALAAFGLRKREG